MFHKVKSVTPLPNYMLLVHFADGVAKQYDVKPLFESMEDFKAFQTIPGLFEQVTADPGGYGICLLYTSASVRTAWRPGWFEI